MSSAKFALAGIVCMAVGSMYFVPYMMKKSQKRNLQNSQDPLPPAARQRGAYLNTGSKDVGPDPDWDPLTHTWKGKRPDIRSSTDGSPKNH